MEGLTGQDLMGQSMSTHVLFVVHQCARGEEMKEYTIVQTGNSIDKSSVYQVVSLPVNLVMLPWVNRARTDLVFIFHFLPYLLSLAFEFKKK
jgi:hypothetical protein